MNDAEVSEAAALAKQFENFAKEKRPIEAVEIIEELARDSGGLQRISPDCVRAVLQELCEERSDDRERACQKLLFLWCREREWDDEVIAEFFLELVDELNEYYEVPRAMDQLALKMAPTAQRWIQWAQWEASELNAEGELSGLRAEQILEKLQAQGWQYDFTEFARHPRAKGALAEAPEAASDEVVRGVLQFFRQWI